MKDTTAAKIIFSLAIIFDVFVSVTFGGVVILILMHFIKKYW